MSPRFDTFTRHAASKARGGLNCVGPINISVREARRREKKRLSFGDSKITDKPALAPEHECSCCPDARIERMRPLFMPPRFAARSSSVPEQTKRRRLSLYSLPIVVAVG